MVIITKTRKLQETGKKHTWFTITLPKDFVNTLRVKKGEPVFISIDYNVFPHRIVLSRDKLEREETK